MKVRALLVVGALGGCGGGGGFPADASLIDAVVTPGAFSLAWTVNDANNQAISCASIGAQSVTALLRNRAVSGGSTEVFTCQTGQGMSQSLIPGTYDIDFELVGVGGDPTTGLIATAPRQLGIVIEAGKTTALTPLTFAVDATGGLALSIASGAVGGNCAPTGSNGAGITTMTLTLEKASDNSCVPITFAVGTGGATYTVNCTTPTPIACIESTQTLTATGLVSGSYIVKVNGNVGASTCWKNTDTLPVPPLGRSLSRTLNLAFQTGAPGC